mmetsp:Transcript_48095/g.72735  ORF Transcript_48095/g.72735 Transcript_48095/m.72735 type:complete len:92 (-) Transcript_48095:130-405(-)
MGLNVKDSIGMGFESIVILKGIPNFNDCMELYVKDVTVHSLASTIFKKNDKKEMLFVFFSSCMKSTWFTSPQDSLSVTITSRNKTDNEDPS